MIYSCQDVHQHPVIRPLVEFCLLVPVILIEHLADELQDLGHELMLVEAEHLQEDDNELHKAIDIPEVEPVCWPLLAAIIPIDEGLLNACLHHHSAKAEQQLWL